MCNCNSYCTIATLIRHTRIVRCLCDVMTFYTVLHSFVFTVPGNRFLGYWHRGVHFRMTMPCTGYDQTIEKRVGIYGALKLPWYRHASKLPLWNKHNSGWRMLHEYTLCPTPISTGKCAKLDERTFYELKTDRANWIRVILYRSK